MYLTKKNSISVHIIIICILICVAFPLYTLLDRSSDGVFYLNIIPLAAAIIAFVCLYLELFSKNPDSTSIFPNKIDSTLVYEANQMLNDMIKFYSRNEFYDLNHSWIQLQGIMKVTKYGHETSYETTKALCSIQDMALVFSNAAQSGVMPSDLIDQAYRLHGQEHFKYLDLPVMA